MRNLVWRNRVPQQLRQMHVVLSSATAGGSRERQWCAILAGEIDLRSVALPTRVTISRSTVPFSWRDMCPQTNFECRAGGSGRPAKASKSKANSMKDTC